MYIVNLFMLNPATRNYDLDNTFGPFPTREKAEAWGTEAERETSRVGMRCSAVVDVLVAPGDLWRTQLPSGHPDSVQRGD